MGGMWIVITIPCVIIGAVIVAYIIGQNRKSNGTDRINEILKEVEAKGLHISQHHISFNVRSCLAFDEENKKFCFIYGDPVSMGYNVKIVDYKDILESEIIEDNVQVMKTSRSSQIGGALAGGALAGGVGAIIGGLSGKQTTSNNKTRKLDLKVTIADTRNPVINFSLLNLPGEGISKHSSIYETEIKSAQHWHGLISVAIREAENENILPIREGDNKISVAEELTKLSVLLKDGLITREEFDTQKQKIMSQ
ncbi:hypothetical protein D1872_165610 [compost metagenome]